MKPKKPFAINHKPHENTLKS